MYAYTRTHITISVSRLPAHRHLSPSSVPWTSHVQLLPTVLSETVVLAVIRKNTVIKQTYGCNNNLV